MAGRPLKIGSPEEMQEKIDAYFAECDPKGESYTITGLTMELGFLSRQSLLDYVERNQGKEKFADIIKKAKLKVENAYEKRLNEPYPTGAIFVLKNFGWKDQIEIEHGTKEGDPAALTDLQLAARLVYLIELALRRKKEAEAKGALGGKSQAKEPKELLLGH